MADEDKCNLAIKRELEKGPPRIRVLTREELKMEIRKYKNISLKIIKDFQATGAKVPGYANKLAKEEATNKGMDGLKVEKSDKSNMDGDSMFEVQSEIEEEIPEKA